ncbi:MAG: phosphoenolpyruvate synthase, partial [Proteobacteria bacterium]|nr:phosphoenolpyruvate synthase [Pseudomonadota bacterium]
MEKYVIRFESLGMNDVERVGGKNASLGEMISNLANAGVKVPGGFATTAQAYRDFLAHEGLAGRINTALTGLDVDDIRKLASTGKQIREWVMSTPFPAQLRADVTEAYEQLVTESGPEASFAVRSSATAEDLPDASFAGQQETFLNVKGLESIIEAMHEVFASLFNDRAIAYRVHQGFDHSLVALSAGVQRMVRSDIGASGVMFTLDTESGFRDAVFITSAYGLGETVVQGAVNPDEFYVYKPSLAAGKEAILRRSMGGKAIQMVYSDEAGHGRSTKTIEVPEADRSRFSLTDAEVQALAKQAVIIEQHYERPMDIEWGKDGNDGELYVLQARPETVQSRTGQVIERYHLMDQGKSIAEGRAIGQRIGSGTARVLKSIDDMHRVAAGDVLVTDMTDPDWEPIMKRASAIVTNRGGRTCHAAIIARELGIPAVVGCGDATDKVKDGSDVTVSCAEGDTGYIYDGRIDFEKKEIQLDNMPEIPLKIMMNVANPERAFSFAALPHRGIGLARLEFIINVMIGVHPKALINFDRMEPEIQKQIQRQIAGYADPVTFYVDKLAEGISTLAAAFAPEPVIVRMSDFKSNEYANLLGGRQFEPHEENPMIGYRGASRYVSENFRDCFELEVKALKKVRDDMGLTNVQVMIPFVRTVDEGRQVVELLANSGLKRGENGLKLIMMCELPSNALLADEFLGVVGADVTVNGFEAHVLQALGALREPFL